MCHLLSRPGLHGPGATVFLPPHFTATLSTYSLSITKNSNLLISVVLLWTPCPEAEVQHCHDRFELREGKKQLILEQPPSTQGCPQLMTKY